ncbi:copper resistance protein NlpE N-terminal domain-containing protein [Pontibacter mangrovi]|uniref:Copper resistance protein NlpE n=1 Tax=Pontibacter mangrovi TaxID=2589816 RepID=A0A501W7L8_9BACT|nr:copper resistance protein NlpE N-terminal domain-containing protein [Pontibacter mangrovi]TPE42867.1 hypothetical protein FJM65_16205 [Pontibacter mangrovi]
MRRKYRVGLWLGAMLFYMASCTTSPGGDVSTEPTDVGAAKTLAPTALVGTWRGVIPCADCPGINYSLSLSENNTFAETLMYQDRDVQPYTRTGTWRIADSTLELLGDSGNGGISRFSLAPQGELNMLDPEGKPFATSLAPMYRLRRDTALIEDNAALWDKRRERGIDFVATGNEPGWVLEIDLEDSIRFRTLPSESIHIVTAVPAPAEKGNTTTYSATSAAGELQVEILEQPCEDTMSGKISSYLVRVKANSMAFSGCGTYLNSK